MVEKREKPLGLDMSFQEALARFAATWPSEVEYAIKAGRCEQMEPKQGEFQLVHYKTTECQADLALDPTNETMWATQPQIADAFGISTNTVGEHLKNIFREGELDEAAVTRKFRATGKDGKVYNYLHYNLGAILSVGYRVSSKRATAFRQFATGILKDYLVQGFAINEARLKDDPHALRELAAKVRELRSNEANIYKSVRDVFAFASSDYSKEAPDVGRFFAKLQDKFTYAVTGQRSSDIKGRKPSVARRCADSEELLKQRRALSAPFTLRAISTVRRVLRFAWQKTRYA
jgi:DNA-binding Lrp family transcriptional regulator